MGDCRAKSSLLRRWISFYRFFIKAEKSEPNNSRKKNVQKSHNCFRFNVNFELAYKLNVASFGSQFLFIYFVIQNTKRG